MSAAAARPSFPAEADVSRLKTIEVVGSFDDFLRGLPSILEADSFRSVARGIASAIRSQRGVAGPDSYDGAGRPDVSSRQRLGGHP